MYTYRRAILHPKFPITATVFVLHHDQRQCHEDDFAALVLVLVAVLIVGLSAPRQLERARPPRARDARALEGGPRSDAPRDPVAAAAPLESGGERP